MYGKVDTHGPTQKVVVIVQLKLGQPEYLIVYSGVNCMNQYEIYEYLLLEKKTDTSWDDLGIT